ncbi:16S rRNA (guanine(966)-N(2))-methyltransferase RsmD [Eubacteriales bacterium OttesenSCG-928-K08]|nr:16S rRNA (guanine(966)-N(2))-methyltransferase RsmD [Eubacteriales bacterium OttesenSCG-928-K08]
MRIIAGSAKGRPIITPKNSPTRPTLARVKESLFGILQFRLPGASVLDLYAGSGNLGLEALSRGAAFAVFNDLDRECALVIQKNIETFGFSSRTKVLCMDAKRAISFLSGQAFDIIFLDPPYVKGAGDILKSLFESKLVAPDGLVVVEHALGSPPEGQPGLFERVDARKYGDTGLCFYEYPK